MEKEQEIALDKSRSKKVTTEGHFKTIRGDLLQYNEDLTARGYDKPKLELVVSEDLEKHQNGIVRLIIHKPEGRDSYLLHIDGLMGCIYASYAKSLNDLRKPTIRQQAVRIHTIFTKIWDRLVKERK